MAYRFPPGHEESESGEKALHGRLHQQPFLPYNQPSTSAGPLALLATEQEAQRSPSWFRGFISGAGKLISSVLGSEGSVSSHSECDSDCCSDEENDSRSNKHVDHLLSDGLAEFNKRKSVVDGNVEPLAIVSKSDSKLVIEQLLMQETFTRAEYGKLMTILRSRVLDIPSAKGGERAQNEVPKSFSDKRPWQLWNPNRNVIGTSGFSLSNPSVFTPGYYASEAVTPDPCSKAVLEAKKWFEQKKLSSSPICDQEFGPCSLNTDMNQYCFDGDDGSPIEMARSYMQSSSPWGSPSFGTIGFKSPPSSEKQSCSIGTHLFPSSKVGKRDYAATRTWDPKENSTISFKSIYNEPRITKWRKTSSTTGPLALEHSRATSATPSFGYQLADEYLKLHDRKAPEVGDQRETYEELSQRITRAEFAAMETPKYLSPDFLAMYCYDVNKPIARQNKGVDFTSVTKAQ
ncbi:uncharacterized protein LOC110024603, partial [Phalaenopsis equestris]|uniref:uncharacterized protein LOC110024603 n=1 Tax=Phalaenopsis equestris TaxID=78828 RepID=UPI0009E1AB4A